MELSMHNLFRILMTEIAPKHVQYEHHKRFMHSNIRQQTTLTHEFFVTLHIAAHNTQTM